MMDAMVQVIAAEESATLWGALVCSARHGFAHVHWMH